MHLKMLNPLWPDMKRDQIKEHSYRSDINTIFEVEAKKIKMSDKMNDVKYIIYKFILKTT